MDLGCFVYFLCALLVLFGVVCLASAVLSLLEAAREKKLMPIFSAAYGAFFALLFFICAVSLFQEDNIIASSMEEGVYTEQGARSRMWHSP